MGITATRFHVRRDLLKSSPQGRAGVLKWDSGFGNFPASRAEEKPADCDKGGNTVDGPKDGGSGQGGSGQGGGTSSGRDFIQQLFIEKIREYDKKKKENGGKTFDPIPELENERQHLLDVLMKTFFKTTSPPGDMTSFPNFDFKDPPLDPIDSKDESKKK